MDTTRRYLAGDIHSLAKVNKIVPRKMELPMLMQSRIQIRKNRFGIKSRFFEHMKSYDYKFKSLAAEPKQVIRALQPRKTIHPRDDEPQLPRKTLDRSMVEKSSSWKLPPNVYRLKDHFLEVSKRQMGKLGPYQCFTVERDSKSIRTHFAVKPAEEYVDIFYELPSLMEEMTKAENKNKAKFLKSERFEREKRFSSPSPTKYYPQNFVLKPGVSRKSDEVKQPLFYYPSSSVPLKELSIHREYFFKPSVGRYNPHDVTCKCYQTEDNQKCPGKIPGDGHCHVFDSVAFRLVHPVKITRRRTVSEPSENDEIIRFPRPPREPFSFRPKRALSSDDANRVIRFNTMVKKRNLFSVKTGRPVAFLTAAPRFKEKSEITIKLDKEKKNLIPEESKKPQRKPITKERLAELATPKNALPKIASKKIEVFVKLRNITTVNHVDEQATLEIALEKPSVESST